MTLEQAMGRGRANNLDILRLVAALGVVVSHAWPLAAGPGTAEPLDHTFGLSLGAVSVLVFFFVSGLLISQSAEQRAADKPGFVRARLRRIFPGLAVALVVTAALAMVFGATPGAGEVVAYVLRGVTLVSLQHELTGAWADNPFAGAVNGPLWTLVYEVLCYAIFAALVWWPRLRWVLIGALAAGALLATQHAGLSYRLQVFWPLALAFALGHLAWLGRARLVLDWRGWVLGLALLAGAAAFPLGEATLVWALAVLVPMLAYRLPALRLPSDVSYGVYIYGWPVAQACVALVPGISPVGLALLSGIAVLPFAWLSWTLIERPFLRANRRRPAQHAA